MALARDKAAYGENCERRGLVIPARRYREALRVHPAPQQAELVPLVGLDERHQLATHVVADANHKRGPVHLLGELVAFDVEELRRTVERQTPRPLRAAVVGDK